METTLFWIACGLLGYALILREAFKREMLIHRPSVSATLHILFTTSVGGLIGFVVSASTDLHGPSPRWPLTFAIGGLVWGIIQIVTKYRKAGGTQALLTDDLEWAETSYSAILLAALIMYAVVQAFKIPSGSMEDTLRIGDHLFVNKFIYGIRVPFTDKRVLKFREVRRGEIVVFEAPESAITSPDERQRGVRKDFIKRAIGLPGDEIRIRNKTLYVNGQPQRESYVAFRDPTAYPAARLNLSATEYQKIWEQGKFASLRREEIGDNFGPVRVPPGYYFVMGDNRDGSFDARFWGPLPNRLLKGKAWVVYWPLKRVKVIR